ncbi:MAG TPA: O-antigen ligase family protein [Candidatus Eisenbacteria bacterium]
MAIALSVLFFVPFLREGFESPKAAAVRACGFGALGMALAAGRAWRRVTWTPLDLAVLLWLGVEVLATAVSVSPRLSWIGEPVQREGLLTSVALTGLYFATRLATMDRDAAERSLDVVLAASALASAFALVQAAGLDPVRWASTPPAGGDALHRAFGTLGHPNLLGVVSAAVAAVALARAGGSARGRFLHLAALALYLVATLLTLSRAAWLGALSALGVVAGLLARQGRVARVPARRLAVAGLLVAAMVLPFGSTRLRGELGTRLHGLIFSPTAGSGASRLEIWRSAWHAWLARPWLGHGPDTFALVFPRYQTPEYWRHEWGGLAFHAHSIYFHTLATRGLLGLMASAFWGVAAGLAARRAWRAAPAARPLVTACTGMLCAILGAGTFGALGVTGHLLVVTCSAALAALAAPGIPPPPRGRPWLALSLGLGLAIPVTVWGVRELLGSSAAATADQWLLEARATLGAPSEQARLEALAAARRAVAYAPEDDALPRLLSEASIAAAAASPSGPDALLGEAASAARRAVRLVPERVENHEQLARALVAQVVIGDAAASDEADQELRRAVELAPVNALILDEASQLELMIGHADEALGLARRSVSLDPGDARAHAAAAAARFALGDREGAASELRCALAGEWHGDVSGRGAAEAMLARLRAEPRGNPRRSRRPKGSARRIPVAGTEAHS